MATITDNALAEIWRTAGNCPELRDYLWTPQAERDTARADVAEARADAEASAPAWSWPMVSAMLSASLATSAGVSATLTIWSERSPGSSPEGPLVL
jgi:hypothetical protein